MIVTSNSDLSADQSKELFTLISIVNYLNSANNSIQIRFSSLVAKKEGINEKFSILKEEQLIDFHKQ